MIESIGTSLALQSLEAAAAPSGPALPAPEPQTVLRFEALLDAPSEDAAARVADVVLTRPMPPAETLTPADLFQERFSALFELDAMAMQRIKFEVGMGRVAVDFVNRTEQNLEQTLNSFMRGG